MQDSKPTVLSALFGTPIDEAKEARMDAEAAAEATRQQANIDAGRGRYEDEGQHERQVARAEKMMAVTDEDISELGHEAMAAGDSEQVDLCRSALAGDHLARRKCEAAIVDALAMGDE